MKMRIDWAFGSLLAISIAASAQAQTARPASDAAPDGVADIIVTAQRREQKVQDVPISIAVVSGDQLQDRNVTDLQNLSNYVPNLTLVSVGGIGESEPIIRGIDSSVGGVGGDASVGVYVDGVYQSIQTSGALSLLDIDRVEVLRGPQGTLYGRNAIGGAINVVTRQPGDSFRATAFGRYDSLDGYEATANVSGPLAPGLLAASIGYGRSRQGAYTFDRLLNREVGDATTETARFALRLTPSERFNATLVAFYQRATGSGSIYDPQGPGSLTAAVPLPAFGYVPEASAFDRSIDRNAGDQEQKFYGANLTLNYDLAPNWVLTSITGYQKSSFDEYRDNDMTRQTILFTREDNDGEEFSQELRLVTPAKNPLSFVGGLYYYEKTYDTHPRTIFGPDGISLLYSALAQAVPSAAVPSLPTPNLFTVQDVVTPRRLRAFSYAAFGELTYRLSDTLSVIGGLRVSRERKRIVLSQFYEGQLATPIPGLSPTFYLDTVGTAIGQAAYPAFSASYSETKATPAITLQFRPAANTQLYAKVATGFKAGGFNTNQLATVGGQPVDPSFKSETLINYEAGIKADLFDNKFRANAAVFWQDYSDKQITIFDGVNSRTVNAGKVRSRGFELEAIFRPIAALQAGVNVGYADSRYIRFNDGFINYDGNRTPNSPEWSLFNYLEYAATFSRGTTFTLRGEHSYRSRVYFDDANSGAVTADPRSIFNLRASLGMTNGLTLSAYVENIFDKTYVSGAFYSTLTQQAQFALAPPRVYGGSLRFKF